MTNATTMPMAASTATATVEKLPTRKDALVAAIAKFDESDPIRKTLEKMLEQVSKKRTGETPSQVKAKAERKELMKACIDAMNAHPDAKINSTWLNDNVNGVTSTQKATVLMGNAIKDGLVEKYYEGKRTYYRVISK